MVMQKSVNKSKVLCFEYKENILLYYYSKSYGKCSLALFETSQGRENAYYIYMQMLENRINLLAYSIRQLDRNVINKNELMPYTKKSLTFNATAEKSLKLDKSGISIPFSKEKK